MKVHTEEQYSSILKDFFAERSLSAEVVSYNAESMLRTVFEPGSLVIRTASGREDVSEKTVLAAGGTIFCGTALNLADAVGISRRITGELLNALNIKVRACSLGCFK